MVAILGISAFYHDSAAALLVDGEIIAAAQEERFTRKKHDPSYPVNAINYCLLEAGISLDQVKRFTSRTLLGCFTQRLLTILALE
jgi:carbamoyltransferase